MTAETETPVLTEIRQGVGIVELNRPDKFNCLSSGVISGLDAALTAFEDDKSVRVILIRGRGKYFCTGADLDEVLVAREKRDELGAFIANGHRMLRRLELSPLPVVVAIHGLCLAGGLELMMSCDVAFAARSAKLGCQHARYGLVPGWGGTQRLPRLVGVRRGLDLMYSARWLDASEARDWGLVNYVTADDALMSDAEAYCADLAKKSPDGLASMKALGREGLDKSLAEGLVFEGHQVVDALLTDNVSEGLAAFQARREPVFR